MEPTLTDLNSRSRGRIPFRKLFALLAMQLISATCLAADTAGVRSYAGMSLDDVRQPTVEKWRESLSQPWRLGGQPVVFSLIRHGEPLKVDRCTALFAALDSGVRAWGADKAIFDGWAVQCLAVRAVVNAESPRQSHLESFNLDQNGTRALPVELAFQISHNDTRKVTSIKSAGGSLAKTLGSGLVLLYLSE